MARRNIAMLVACMLVMLIYLLLPSSPKTPHLTDYTKEPIHHVTPSHETVHGDVIMPKLGNETLKAELGRASWKLFHTMMSRYPEKPTTDESAALDSYIHLFARLYPCGECAGHFRAILKKYPPQTSSRNSAAAWGCHVHNEVNKSLQKPMFNCNNIGDFYKCGCAGDEKKEGEETPPEKPEMSAERIAKLKEAGRDLDYDLLTEMGRKARDKAAKPEKITPLKLEKEG